MKIQLEIEEEHNRPPWYKITIDGEHIAGFWGLEEAQKTFEELKINPNLLKKTTKILDSQEIVVPLLEENSNNEKEEKHE